VIYVPKKDSLLNLNQVLLPVSFLGDHS